MRTKNLVFSVLTLLLFSSYAFAQVTGTVVDNFGPVVGAEVVALNSNESTLSDESGNFSINAELNEILKITNPYSGSSLEVTVDKLNMGSIDLSKSAIALGPITITGALGIKTEEKRIVGAVQNLGGEEINKAREANVVNSLSGKISGVQITNSSGAVGASSRIVLRGPSSLTGNNQPIYIVDGVFINDSNFGSAGSSGGFDLQNGIADINADDIEEITVLKGPAAAALYGTDASRGVILITTKSGRGTKGLGVSLNSTFMMSSPLVMPSYQNSYGQGGGNYFQFVDGANGIGDGTDESWGPALDVGLNFVQWDSYKNGGNPTPWVSYPDNVKDFFDTGILQTNNLALSYGDSNANVRLAVGNYRETGIIPFTYLNKYNATLSGGAHLNDKLSMNAKIQYVNSKSNSAEGGYSSANPMQQLVWSARNVDLNALKDWRSLPLTPDSSPNGGTPLNWNTRYQSNLFWRLETSTNKQDEDRYLGNLSMTYDFTDWLGITGRTGIDNISSVIKSKVPKLTEGYRDGYYRETVRNIRQLTSDLLVNINKDFGDDYSITSVLGATARENKTDLVRGTVTALEIPGLYTLSNPKSGTNTQSLNRYYKDRLNSVYGSLELGFRDFLYVTATGRNDWSSVLPTENNSFFYPSIGTSIILSELWEKNKTVDYLKVRGNWAKVGGFGPLGAYFVNDTYSLGSDPFGSVLWADTQSSVVDPNITPEFQIGYEFGIDAKFFDKRLGLSASYYNQKGEDLIVPLQVTRSTGVGFIYSNAADMTNKGIELQVNVDPIRSKNFNFGFDVNFAKNDNNVDRIGDENTNSLILGGQWGIQTQAHEGQPYGAIYGYGFERTEDGQIIYEGGTPKISGDLVLLGDTQPDWTGGLNLRAGYKNLTVNALIDAKMGGYVHSMTNAWGRYAGVLEETAIGRETGIVGVGVMEMPDGSYAPNNVVVTTKNFNQATFNNNLHESSLFDASYVKLRQVMISYDVPKMLYKNTPIDALSISLVGRNLAMLYKKAPHIDPETGFSNDNGSQGLEFGQTPSVRTMGINLNVNF